MNLLSLDNVYIQTECSTAFIFEESDLEQKDLAKYKTLSKKTCAQAWTFIGQGIHTESRMLGRFNQYISWLLLDLQGFFRKMKLSSGLHFIVSSGSKQLMKNYITH